MIRALTLTTGVASSSPGFQGFSGFEFASGSGNVSLRIMNPEDVIPRIALPVILILVFWAIAFVSKKLVKRFSTLGKSFEPSGAMKMLIVILIAVLGTAGFMLLWKIL